MLLAADESSAGTAVYVAFAVAGGLYGLWERWNKQKTADANAELTRRAKEDEDTRQRTAEWIAMHVSERDRALKRLDEQQKAHIAAIEQAASKTAECNALIREKEALEKKLAACEHRE